MWGKAPQIAFKRSAKGELKNSPVDCFLRGNALQVRAFPYESYPSVQSVEVQKSVNLVKLMLGQLHFSEKCDIINFEIFQERSGF